MTKGIEPRRWGANLQPNLFEQGREGRRGTVMPRWTGGPVDVTLPSTYLRAEPCDLPSLSGGHMPDKPKKPRALEIKYKEPKKKTVKKPKKKKAATKE